MEITVPKDSIFEGRGQNSVFSKNYRVDPKLGKHVFFLFVGFHVNVQPVLLNLIKLVTKL